MARGAGGRSSAGPAGPAARPAPGRSIGSTPAPLLLSRQFPLFAQSDLQEEQEYDSAEAESDQPDRERFAGRAADQGSGDRPRDDERRGRSECEDAPAGRHRPKVSLRLAIRSGQRGPETLTPAR
jgi:hypothetical protein